MLALFVHLSTYLAGAASRARDDQRGQASAEYALVLLGAAAVALLIVAWATTQAQSLGHDPCPRHTDRARPYARLPDRARL